MDEVCQTIVTEAPDVTRLMRTLGEPVDAAMLTAFSTRYGEAQLYALVGMEDGPTSFWTLWNRARKREYWELFELLMLEHSLSLHPDIVARQGQAGPGFGHVLFSVRRTVAMSLYARAKELNWKEPLTFIRALRVAERYLQWCVRNAPLVSAEYSSGLEGRLGVCLVLRSRFEDVSSIELAAAGHWIANAVAAGSTHEGHNAYYAEAQIRLYDLTGEAQVLISLEAWFAALPAMTSQTSALRAEAWLRLGDAARSVDAAQACRSRAIAHAADVGQDDALAFTLAKTVAGLAQARLTRQAASDTRLRELSLRGLRLPFGLKQHARRWLEQDLVLCRQDVAAVIHELEASTLGLASGPLSRRVQATALSVLAATEKQPSTKVARLRRAVDVRASTGGRRGLTDPESRLENAVDLIGIHAVARTRDTLLASLQAALSLAQFDQAWPTPLLLLAQQVEDCGGTIPLEVAYTLRQQDLGKGGVALRMVLSGDYAGLYSEAAARALESREIDQHSLGGRGGAYLAADFAGVVSEVFVFKPTTELLADREDARAHKISQVLARRGLDHRFSVAKTLARTALPADDVLRNGTCEVLVARQFHHGMILADYVATAGVTERRLAMESALEFLALIQVCERETSAPVARARRELRKQEMGRWLRDGLKMEDAAGVFDQWLSAYPDLPYMPRRDAHAYNWLVTASRGLVAIDLEACGWRPFGYEVAQLIEDAAVVPADGDGYRIRRALVRHYVRALSREGITIDGASAQLAFDLSVLARAVRGLTDPSADLGRRQHAEALLKLLSDKRGPASNTSCRELAAGLLAAWAIRSGAATGTGVSVSGARRRHLSRAMAYELRHGQLVNLTDDGWAYVASVADALTRRGLNASKAEIQAVATAVDEQRFELAEHGRRIRARYGHTRQVVIHYQEAPPGLALFHGTSLAATENIFAAAEGLQPRGRLWVHLSSSARLAAMTAKRHGPGVLLVLAPADAARLSIRYAGGTTYLVKAVPPEFLSVASLLQEQSLGLPNP